MLKNHKQITLIMMGILFLVACSAPAQVVPDNPTQETAAGTVESAAPAPATATSEPLAALVNGEPILLADYERQIARYEASMSGGNQEEMTPEEQEGLSEAREWILDLMIDQILITQAAEQAGTTVTDEEVEAAIQDLIADIGQETFEQNLTKEGLTAEEMRAELKTQMLASRMAEQVANTIPAQAEHVNARHIVVATEEEGHQILSQIQAGADFAALAQAYSQDAFTRNQGGDLGYFPKGVLTSSKVEEAAFSLQPGQVSDLIQSNLGYHIIQVLDRVPDMEVSPDNLRMLKDKAVRDWLEGLHTQADVQRFVSSTP